jgi:hypothetical protein
MLTSLPSVFTGRFDVDLGDTTGKFFHSCDPSESTNTGDRYDRDENSDEDGESPGRSTRIKVFDTLLEIDLEMGN